jgi:EAL domain
VNGQQREVRAEPDTAPLWAVLDKEITTVEGLGPANRPHPVTEALIAGQAASRGHAQDHPRAAPLPVSRGGNTGRGHVRALDHFVGFHLDRNRVLARPGGSAEGPQFHRLLHLQPVLLSCRPDLRLYLLRQAIPGARIARNGMAFEAGDMTARLQAEFPRALRDGQVVAHFQPEVELAAGRLAGAELLARWEHPELGTLQRSPPITAQSRAESAGATAPFVARRTRGGDRDSLGAVT